MFLPPAIALCKVVPNKLLPMELPNIVEFNMLVFAPPKMLELKILGPTMLLPKPVPNKFKPEPPNMFEPPSI